MKVYASEDSTDPSNNNAKGNITVIDCIKT